MLNSPPRTPSPTSTWFTDLTCPPNHSLFTSPSQQSPYPRTSLSKPSQSLDSLTESRVFGKDEVKSAEECENVSDTANEMSLDSPQEDDKILFQVLNAKDIGLIKEALARIRFAKDLARVRASQQHLSAAIASHSRARQEAARLKEKMDQMDFESITSRQRQAFRRSSIYQVTRPHLVNFLTSLRRNGHREDAASLSACTRASDKVRTAPTKKDDDNSL